MKRTTLFIEEALERDLQAIARQEKRPVAWLVREALAEYVANREPGNAPALSFIGAGASGRTDTAERHEELLWREERAAKKKAPARKAPRKAR
jgi:predicted transcriptional regulator